MVKKLLLTDVDGVLLNWKTPFVEYVKSLSDAPLVKDAEYWDIKTWIDHPRPLELVENFNTSGALRELKSANKAKEYLEKIHEQYDIIAVTSVNDSARLDREHNLKEVFGNIFMNIVCVPLGCCKGTWLARFRKDSVWIEDRPENVMVGHKLGFNSFIMDQPYNRIFDFPDDVSRVSDWAELYEILT